MKKQFFSKAAFVPWLASTTSQTMYFCLNLDILVRCPADDQSTLLEGQQS